MKLQYALIHHFTPLPGGQVVDVQGVVHRIEGVVSVPGEKWGGADPDVALGENLVAAHVRGVRPQFHTAAAVLRQLHLQIGVIVAVRVLL